jgi:hypothetical protein
VDLPSNIAAMLIEILIRIVSIAFLMSFAFAIGFGLWRLIEIPLRRWRDSTFDYVHVDDNGNARELNADEEEYVTTALFLDDDTDFFIKSSYESLNSNGELRGYLRRRELPQHVAIAAAATDEASHI